MYQQPRQMQMGAVLQQGNGTPHANQKELKKQTLELVEAALEAIDNYPEMGIMDLLITGLNPTPGKLLTREQMATLYRAIGAVHLANWPSRPGAPKIDILISTANWLADQL